MVGRRNLERVGSVSEPSRDVRVFHFGFACMLQLVTVEDYNWRCKCVSAVSFQNIQYICSANYYSVNRHFIGQKCSTLRISIQFQRTCYFWNCTENGEVEFSHHSKMFYLPRILFAFVVYRVICYVSQ